MEMEPDGAMLNRDRASPTYLAITVPATEVAGAPTPLSVRPGELRRQDQPRKNAAFIRAISSGESFSTGV